MGNIVGRLEEQQILSRKIDSREPELIAIYGRRRVGKTYLVREYCKNNIVFEMTGIHEVGMADQLQNFSKALQQATKSDIAVALPANWIQAFAMLDTFLDRLPAGKPAVVFFDEFPWIQTPRSFFLRAFDHWWNSSASRKPFLKVVICGSAASWMIENIIRNRGGLHNRVTQTIRLLPFSLSETKQYLSSRGVALNDYQLLQLYMAMGGIPHYLQHISAGESAAQAIDRMCFTKDGFLKEEFKILYQSLFANSRNHELVIRALAAKGIGLTRQEIIEECGFTSGGTTSKTLKELEESGFITPYIPFGKTGNDSIYKLSDEYSMFYIKFIEGAKATGEGSWLRRSATPSYSSWSGFAFESVCQKHTAQIRRALGISGVLTEVSGWRYVPPKGSSLKGTQIDLLLDRADHCINICEMKFSTNEYVIDKKYAAELDNKVNIFKIETETRKAIFPTVITTYSVRRNEHYTGRVLGEVVMSDLFA